MLEQKFEKSRFTRVDSDVIDNLIIKEDKKGETLEGEKQEAITTAFKSQLPKMDKVEFNVMTQALGDNSAPVMITQSEYMRRICSTFMPSYHLTATTSGITCTQHDQRISPNIYRSARTPESNTSR